MAKMYLKFNSAVIKEFLIDKATVTFGRKSDNDIVIDHPTVSGHHGRLFKTKDHYVVEDLNSTNGTFINGRRIKNGRIKDHDQIGVAGHILDFYDNDAVSISLSPPVDSTPKLTPPPLVVAAAPTTPSPGVPAAPTEIPAGGSFVMSVIAGGVDGQTRISLKEMVTYIGAKATAAIRIKGFLAPDLAGVITRRPEGYVLKALKPGYIKVDDVPLQDQILLKNRTRLEMGPAIMLFVKTD